MSELQVVQQDAEQVEVMVPLDESDARRLDQRIRLMAGQVVANWVKLRALVDEARLGQVHLALGYPSWTAYVADVGGELSVTAEIRPEVVELLASAGMSTRAIAAVTGASKSTIARDISGVPSGTPDTEDASDAPAESVPVTGLDGKTYGKPKRKPKPDPAPAPVAGPAAEASTPESEPEPASTRQVQIQTAFRSLAADVVIGVEALDELTRDARWQKASARFTAKDLDGIERAGVTLERLRTYLLEAISPRLGTTEQPEVTA